MSTITIQTEMARCLERMSTLTPGEEPYQQTLGCLSNLMFLSQSEHRGFPQCPTGPVGDLGVMPEQPDAQEMESNTTTEDPDEQSAHTSEPEPKAETEPEPETDQPKYEKAQVREALANARLKGLNVANLIHEVGANSLSGVDPARYGELMDNLAKALEGMS